MLASYWLTDGVVMQNRIELGRFRLSICAVIMAYSLMGCARVQSNVEPEEAMLGARIGAVGHYGANIGIPELYVNGYWGGNNVGWGGGGAGVCCVPLPRKVTKPVFVTVNWETCDTSAIKYLNGRRVDPDAECKSEFHETVVPVHFEVDPGKGGYALFIHFLPGGKVEAWYTKAGPLNPDYPGPKFPLGPAPPSVPFPSRIPGDTASPLQGGHPQGVQP
jgi:hypothetical protein